MRFRVVQNIFLRHKNLIRAFLSSARMVSTMLQDLYGMEKYTTLSSVA